MNPSQVRDGTPLAGHLLMMQSPERWPRRDREGNAVLPLKRCHHPGAEAEHACVGPHDEGYLRSSGAALEVLPVVWLGNIYRSPGLHKAPYPSLEAILEDGWGVD